MPTPRHRAITVVLIDDHALFRLGLRQLLETSGIDVVGDAASGEAGLALVERHAPDVAVVEPDSSGVETIRRITSMTHRTKVLALASTASAAGVVDVVLAGGSCFLLKEAPAETILAGVRTAASDEALIAPQLAGTLLDQVRATGPRRPGSAAGTPLSQREREVLRLLADGKENDEIAEQLFISPHTVKHHISSILRKLHVTNRIQAAVCAVREAMV